MHRNRSIIAVCTILLIITFSTAAHSQTAEFVKKVFGSNTDAGDIAGRSVSIYRETAVVGAREDESDGLEAGSVYIFERHAGGIENWGEVKRLSAPDGAGSWFGQSVDIYGDVLVVGAKGFFISPVPSKAHVYYRHAGGPNNWGLVKSLSSPEGDGDFGHEVVVYQDTIIVSEIFNSDYERVYIFYRDKGGANNWGLVKTLRNLNQFTLPQDLYGYDIALHGDVLAVAENFDDTPVGVHIYYRDRGGEDNWGLVKEFGFDDNLWAFEIHAVDVYGDTIVCGSRDLSSAFILQRDHGGTDNWGIVKAILPNVLTLFGSAVSIYKHNILIGDRQAGSNVTGGVHHYTRSGPANDPWQFVSLITPDDGATGDQFGVSVAQSDQLKTIIGAYLNSERGFVAGAAYIYTLGQDWGSILVNIFPKEAVALGAKWRMSFQAPDNWRPDGNLETYVRGDFYVHFSKVEGYTTPEPINIDMIPGDFVELNVTYEPIIIPDGTLKVRLFPKRVREDSTRWRLIGTDTWYESDEEISLPPGEYKVQVEPYSGLLKPQRMTAIVESNKRTWLRFHYLPPQ